MTIDAIRENIYHHIGNRIRIIYNEGRNKVSSYEGRIVEVYNNVFIVLDHDNKRSFSYYDILIDTVQIYFNV